MIRQVIALLFAATVLVPAGADADEHSHKAVNLCLFFPVATSTDPTISTNFRLNLTYSRVGAVRGIDLNGLVARTDGDFTGGQITGIYSHAGGAMKGLTLTGAVSYVREDARGVQVSGIVNFDRGKFTGLQFAGLFNFAETGVHGIQWSPIFNLSGGDGGFLQWGTIANVTDGDFKGMQISSGVNFVSRDLAGVQLGLANSAIEFRGVQVGALNSARTPHGPQIGIINLSRLDNESIPVGLMSFAANSNTDWVTFGSTFSAANTGVRTAVRGWYSMFTAGVGDLQDDRDDTAFITWNYGYAFGIGDGGLSLGPDLGYSHIMPQPGSTKNDQQQFAIQARVLLEWRFNRRVAAFAGGGVVSRYSEYSTSADSKTEGLGLLGISLF